MHQPTASLVHQPLPPSPLRHWTLLLLLLLLRRRRVLDCCCVTLLAVSLAAMTDGATFCELLAVSMLHWLHRLPGRLPCGPLQQLCA